MVTIFLDRSSASIFTSVYKLVERVMSVVFMTFQYVTLFCMISVRLHSGNNTKENMAVSKNKRKIIPIYDPGRFKIYLLARDTFFQLLIIFNCLGLNLYLKRGLFIHFWVPHSSYSLQGPAVIDQKNIHWRQPLQILPNKIRGSKIDLL